MNSNAQLNTIFELNLDPIKMKLMHKDSGEGWSLDQVQRIELEYRRFLCIMKLFPNEQVAPLFDVDIFWHYHILDTMKYAIDCDHIFGYFLHHYPYSGLRAEDDASTHQRVGVRMQELYEATFFEAYIRPQPAPAITVFPATVAQNDRSYSMRPISGKVTTAWCEAVAQNDRCYSVRPVSDAAKTAWCEAVAQNDKSYSTDLAAGSAKTAWCEAVALNAHFYSERAVPAIARRVWCEAVAQNDSTCQVRTMLEAAA